jgi:nucleoside-diphosphate-sugar epimerase
MIIAATGLSGSIGRHFPSAVLGLKTRLEKSSDEMLEELLSLPKVDCVIHLAAMTKLKSCDVNPSMAYELNCNGALKWFEAAAQAKVGHFIFSSTSHVYGNPFTEKPLPTSFKINPLSVYGKSKANAEIELMKLAEKFPQTKLTIARLFSVISKESRQFLLYSNLHRRAREKDFSLVPGLHYVRDFIAAKDAVHKLLNLAAWSEAPPVVHISNGIGRKVLDLASEVFNEYGLNAKELLKEGPKGPNDVPWLVGEPTEIPEKPILLK